MTLADFVSVENSVWNNLKVLNENASQLFNALSQLLTQSQTSNPSTSRTPNDNKFLQNGRTLFLVGESATQAISELAALETKFNQLKSTGKSSGKTQRNRTKRKIDNRATKGRKIRYVPIPKLVNFHPAAPETIPWSHERRNELFESIFQY